MRSKMNIRCLLIPLLALGLMSSVQLCLAQREMPPKDDLAFLNNALQAAGASALTTAQETSIKALLAEFRGSHQRPPQNIALQDARTAYEDAILNGNIAAATAQAEILAKAQANGMAQRETDAAALAISVIDVLKTGSGQVDALVAKMGTSRFVRLVLGLAGGPGGFGPGGGGPGRRGPISPE